MPTITSALTLVDWRTRVASLYAEVRTASDPAEGHRIWREGRAELFATHPESPTAGVPELRATGVGYWPYDPAFRFTLPLLDAEPEERDADGGNDGSVTMHRIGRVELPDLGSLDVWWLQQYAGGIFIPMRDGTAGNGSYGAGRYLLDTAKGSWLGGDEAGLVVDLNFAYHPSCRYDSKWTCPLAGVGNRLEARVEAGERL